MIKIYGANGSPFVRKVTVMLDLKGAEYELIHQMPFSGDKEYLKLNPLGKIPTLVDGDLTIGDSKVICRYLEAAFPEPALYPTGAKKRALADWYEEFSGTHLTELATGIFFQRFMKPLAFKQEPDEELISKIINKKLPPVLDYLEERIPSGGYLFGDFMMADLCLVSPFINAGYVGYEVDDSRWPNLAALIAEVTKIPEVASIVETEKATFGF